MNKYKSINPISTNQNTSPKKDLLGHSYIVKLQNDNLNLESSKQ